MHSQLSSKDEGELRCAIWTCRACFKAQMEYLPRNYRIRLQISEGEQPFSDTISDEQFGQMFKTHYFQYTRCVKKVIGEEILSPKARRVYLPFPVYDAIKIALEQQNSTPLLQALQRHNFVVGEDSAVNIPRKVNAVLTFLTHSHNVPVQIVPPPPTSATQAPKGPVFHARDNINSSLAAPEGMRRDCSLIHVVFGAGTLNVPPPPFQIPNLNSSLPARSTDEALDEQQSENDV
ncbi:hypothetical protein SUGI_0485930 [Cryptomeria japonica]|nr:hypothetical protein SUGI_0485930 [Cryptomeria japonica]